MKLVRFCLYVSLGVFLCDFWGIGSIAQAQETIRLSVANSVKTDILDKIAEPLKKAHGISLSYVESTGRQHVGRFKDILDGKVDAAIAPIAFPDWVTMMKEAGITPPQDITHRVIGRDLVQIAANNKASVGKLSLEQIVGIFSGEITNWKAVGGADLPIVVFATTDKPGITQNFKRTALKGKDFTSTLKKVANLDELYKALASTPGGITYLTDSGVKSADFSLVESPPLGRPATMITKGRPNPNVEKLINFIRSNPHLL